MTALANAQEWTLDGVSLSTWAYNIESLNGRNNIPVLAGDNVVVPFRPGAVWKPKYPQQRTFTLGMWVRAVTPEGLFPSTDTARQAQFNENLRTLKELFYVRDRLMTLTKKVRFNSGIETLTTQVECTSPLDPVMVGPNVARLVVDLRMPDPYWVPLTPTTVQLGSQAVDNTITNPGDDITTKIVMVTQPIGTMQGGSANLVIKNTTADPDIILTLVPPATGIQWTMDVEDFFISKSTTPTTNEQSAIQNRSGSAFWMELKKGVNTFDIQAFYGQGSRNDVRVNVTFYPVYV